MHAFKDSLRQRQLHNLVQKLGVPTEAIIDWSLLNLALTHSTVSAASNYEQLEFLGDAVVRLAAAEFLLAAYPHSSVGKIAAIRSVLVSDRTLAQLANYYELGKYLLISNSAAGDKAGQRSRLAEAFEAVLGALYLNTHNLTLIRPWLDPHFAQLAADIRTDPALQNYKAALQEWTQAQAKTLPEYRVEEIGKTHGDSERFSAQVWLKGQLLGEGKGRSIKVAEQVAAQAAFLALREGQQHQA
ncbi:MAG: ribonuclease III [Cyanothece sp. SIO1E1]|nr:ribonuclease III [Cyanothece sp. SIO1E1]